MIIREIEELQKQIARIDEVCERGPLSSDFKVWYSKCLSAIEEFSGTDSSYTRNFRDIKYSPYPDNTRTPDGLRKKAFSSGLEQARNLIEGCIKSISAEPDLDRSAQKAIQVIENLCTRFPRIARQICTEYRSRDTIKIKDEYDVQHLLHALLLVYFDDIRPEEYNPSCAGATSRVDFLVKQEKILIEVKKTRQSLKDKEIGEQLAVDIKRYSVSQECKTLISFVYDPELLIVNPDGLESDLSGRYSDLEVKVIIAPKNI